jgi:hypothetical protein
LLELDIDEDDVECIRSPAETWPGTSDPDEAGRSEKATSTMSIMQPSWFTH